MMPFLRRGLSDQARWEGKPIRSITVKAAYASLRSDVRLLCLSIANVSKGHDYSSLSKMPKMFPAIGVSHLTFGKSPETK